MPLIETEGYTFDVPQDMFDRGEFMAIVATMQGNYARYVRRDLNNTWSISWNLGDIRAPIDPTCMYGDGCRAPEFLGWELVKDPKMGKSGDAYVCVDPNQREFRKASSPSLAVYNGDRFMINEAWGPTNPSPGWRIYRRKKREGAIRLALSKVFSQPLPLP